ncbi:DNA mismatch repair protein MutS [Lentisphaera profundi]|uniref:DNA mismatch repair protein MutS n=1 Tax=Lentisphaera profundi TaxID=1658616 RepID=A0ABY7VQ80_9BACT|nr:DNA mismatch repair protein MutS [Lentisphaera profundi]WDE96152.1 DNA mismatch repair protein MutS [Lentisphaera profundi]
MAKASAQNVKLTPMMRQYLDAKEGLTDDTILLFRLGDFYEIFFEDAERGSEIMGITLTRRNTIPMAGFPYHALDNYLPRILEHGLKVAIAEQMEDPATTKGIVKRAVTRVITAGTVTEDNVLRSSKANFLAAIHVGKKNTGLAFLDLSTGDFRIIEHNDPHSLEAELHRANPSELIVAEDLNIHDLPFALPDATSISPIASWQFDSDLAQQNLLKHFAVKTLEGFGCRNQTSSITAAGALLDYVLTNLKRSADHITSLSLIQNNDCMIIDRVSQRTLELVDPIFRDSKNSTLISVLDECSTPMGSRLLRDWLLRPLTNIEKISQRQDTISSFCSDQMLLEELRESFRTVRDIERILTRLNLGTANPRELQTITWALKAIPDIESIIAYVDSDLLTDIKSRLYSFPELTELLLNALSEELPATLKDGGIISDGYNEQLDHFRKGSREGKAWLARFEAQEKERTGIKKLKIGYNRVFGYFIELSKINSAQAPESYIRKQTLANAERYITPELKEIEDSVLGAEEKAKALEYELFQELRLMVTEKTKAIQITAKALAELDCLANLSYVALKHSYTRPALCTEKKIDISDGRHPVVEAAIDAGTFVPNDTQMDDHQASINLVTGPNMAGKSTYIRQVALLTIMAQMGSFIPCSQAEIGITDSIYTRIGAADDLSRGQSTFMVEMVETANILNNAGSRSLVILDEIGRGTSTYDGLSLAWAIAEHLHETGCLTLFATHYHELTKLGASLPKVKNWCVAVHENKGKIIFLHKIQAGAADRSYGIYVAKLAGIPKSVIKRADSILNDLEDLTGNTYIKNIKKSLKSNSNSLSDNSPDLFDWQSN